MGVKGSQSGNWLRSLCTHGACRTVFPYRVTVSASVCRVYLLLFRVHAFDRPAAAAVVEEEAYVEPGAEERAYAGLGAAVF